MLCTHKIHNGDAKETLNLIKNSIHLVVTSPPYWNAKDYGHPNQIGYFDDLESYFDRLEEIWKGVIKVLCADGKITVNIGNIYFKPSKKERTYTINLIHQSWAQLNKFDELEYMGTIYWKKSVSRNSAVLFGSYPYPSTFMISTALESIHVFRKKGRRKVPQSIKEQSKISLEEFRVFREPVWNINGTSSKKHPAVFPIELPYRLIKLYSFIGDTVLDPFCGIGNTNLAALQLSRNSIGIDINPIYTKEVFEVLKNHTKENPNVEVTLCEGGKEKYVHQKQL